MLRRACGIISVVTAATIAVAAQAPTFSTRVEAVRVDVLVTEHGQPVRGLRAEDFEIRDEGVLQQITHATVEELPLNVILALDLSDSVAGERLVHLRAAGNAALAALEPRDQAALVTFSHAVAERTALTHDVTNVQHELAWVTGAGQTSLIDGLYAAMMLAESEPGRALTIAFSDGVDTSSWLQADAVSEIAKRSDVVVYAVSVRSSVKPVFLRDLTSLTGGQLLEIEKTANLPVVFQSIVNEFTHRYLVSYTPQNVTKQGWHRLDVSVKRKGTSVRARSGYLAAP